MPGNADLDAESREAAEPGGMKAERKGHTEFGSTAISRGANALLCGILEAIQRTGRE